MPRIGGCLKCGGDLIKDPNGDTKCFQCGTITEYSNIITLPENRQLDSVVPGAQRSTKKYIYGHG